jgi:hypothetical protein
MVSFEMLYGCRYRTPLFWNKTGEWKVFGPDILQWAVRQVRMMKENLRIAQSRQKTYVHHRRREFSFEGGDYAYLKVSPTRGLHVSRHETSSHLGTLVRSRSQRSGKKSWRLSFRISFLIRLNLWYEIYFKGVGLSHPKIPNFGMWLKFTKF